MDGEDQGPNLGDFNPSWMEDGGGIYGEQTEPDFSNNQVWDTNAWSRQNPDQDSSPNPAADCIPDGSPDTSKIYVRATHYVGGKWVCYWLETTTCS